MAKKKKKARAHIPTPEEVQRRRNIMSDEEWERRELNERNLKIRNAKNTRFMFVRYGASAMAFINLYWAALIVFGGFTPAIAVPVAQMAGFVVVVLECVRILHKQSDFLKATFYIACASMIVDLIVVGVTLLLGKDVFFPFFSTGTVGVAFVLVCLAVKLVIVRKVLRVRDGHDKAYDRYIELLSE